MGAADGDSSLVRALAGDTMEKLVPWVTGAAFSVVIGVVYIACASAVLIAPDLTISFLNNWMHGIDLAQIQRSPTQPISISGWVSGFVTAMFAAFIAGVVYAWARNFFVRMVR
jgi:hypothetical protein